MSIFLFHFQWQIRVVSLYLAINQKRKEGKMASYHLCIKSGRKGNAANHATYIAREGKNGNHVKRSDLIATDHGNLPSWTKGNPTAFWRTADMHERTNGAAYREYEIAIPTELTVEQQKQLVNEFIRSEIGEKPYQFAIHSPVAALGGIAQPHAHIMFSDRKPDDIDRPPEQHFKRFNPVNPELGGCKKDSGGKDRSVLKGDLMTTRASWAQLQNSSLEKYDHEARVDHRSNKVRGIERTPEKHLGPIGIKKMTPQEKTEYSGKRQGLQQQSF
jgi:hypothetical protein